MHAQRSRSRLIIFDRGLARERNPLRISIQRHTQLPAQKTTRHRRQATHRLFSHKIRLLKHKYLLPYLRWHNFTSSTCPNNIGHHLYPYRVRAGLAPALEACLIVKNHHALVAFTKALFHQLLDPGQQGLPSFGYAQQHEASAFATGLAHSSRQLHKWVFGRPHRRKLKIIEFPRPAQYRAQLPTLPRWV